MNLAEIELLATRTLRDEGRSRTFVGRIFKLEEKDVTQRENIT
jgi:hypothetical protein